MRKAVRSGLCGLATLCAVNVSAAITGVSFGFGWLSGGVAMLFGVPGVVSLLLLNALFLMA